MSDTRDIVVIGASAGGVPVLMEIIRGLPGDVPAAIFIVLHVGSQSHNLLPEILTHVGRLPARLARDGDPIRRGHIYVAPPQFHLLLERDRIRLGTGDREHFVRPAIDVLFRSAAFTYGPRVVGVVLTGGGDDGAMGSRAIKEAGGVMIVQDPAGAYAPAMPRSALAEYPPDYCVPVIEIAPLLIRLCQPAA